MMNLQRLAEVRRNLNYLIAVSDLVGGPNSGLELAVKVRLNEFGYASAEAFEKPQPPAPPAPEPVPEPKRTRHNHITRDIKKLGVCPGCDDYHNSRPTKVTPPTPTPPMPQVPMRKLGKSNSYNPERYVCYRVLWAKVIIRASYDYALWKDSKDMRLRKFAQDAERWLFEPSDLALSFESICFAFDFPMERIRVRTRTLTKNDVKKLEFRERHGRTDFLGEVTGGNDE